MRRFLVSLTVGASLVLVGASPALADAPLYQMLPDAACNDGTAAARIISGNPIVPMYMRRAPVGCMTMPGLHP